MRMKKSVIQFGLLGLALVCLGLWIWGFGEKVRNQATVESAAVPAEPPVSTPAVAVPGDEEAVSGTASLTERETPAVVRSGVGAAGATVRVDRKEAATGEEEADPSEADSPEARMEALARQRVDLSDPKTREEMVRAMTSIEEGRMSAARERALEMGLPLEGDLPGGDDLC